MSDRERKLSANEARFRAFNEGLREVERRVGATPGNEPTQSEFVCECSNPNCEERIRMPLNEYAKLRTAPTRFVIRNGHEVAALERVIRRTDSYSIIEKNPGEAADDVRG